LRLLPPPPLDLGNSDVLDEAQQARPSPAFSLSLVSSPEASLERGDAPLHSLDLALHPEQLRLRTLVSAP